MTSISIDVGITAQRSRIASALTLDAAQTAAFGASTLASAGGWTPEANSGAVASIAITGGTATGYSVVNSRYLAPTSNGSADAGTVILDVTGIDGTVAEVTVTCSTVANAYSVRSGAELEAAVAAIKLVPSYGDVAWTINLRTGAHAPAVTQDATYVKATVPGTVINGLPLTRINGLVLTGTVSDPQEAAIGVDQLASDATATISGGHLRLVAEAGAVLPYVVNITNGAGPIEIVGGLWTYRTPAPYANRNDATSDSVAPTGLAAATIHLGSTDNTSAQNMDLVVRGDAKIGALVGLGGYTLFAPTAVNVVIGRKVVIEDVEIDGSHIPLNVAQAKYVAARRLDIHRSHRTQLRVIPALYDSASDLATRLALDPMKIRWHDITCWDFPDDGNLAGLHANFINIGGQAPGADSPPLHVLATRLWADMRVAPNRYTVTDDEWRVVDLATWPVGSQPYDEAARSSLGMQLVPGTLNPGLCGQITNTVMVLNSQTGVGYTAGTLSLAYLTIVGDPVNAAANGVQGDYSVNSTGPAVGAVDTQNLSVAYSVLGRISQTNDGVPAASTGNVFIDNDLSDGSAQDYATVFAGPITFDGRARFALPAGSSSTAAQIKAALDSVLAHAGGTAGHTVTPATTAPAISTRYPAQSGTHPADLPLVLTFDRPVMWDTRGAERAITLKLVSDNSTVETWTVDALRGAGIGAAGGEAEIYGSSLVLWPSSPLTAGVAYYVEIGNDTIQSAVSSAFFAGLSGAAAWTFTGAAAVASTGQAMSASTDIRRTTALTGPVSGATAITGLLDFTVASGALGSDMDLLEIGNGFATGLLLTIDASGFLRVRFRPDGLQRVLASSSAALVEGQRYRLAWSYDGAAGVFRAYDYGTGINMSASTAAAGQSWTLNWTPTTIGQGEDYDRRFVGDLYRVAVWDAVAVDVLALTNAVSMLDPTLANDFGIGPIIDLSGAAFATGVNAGSGGDFITAGFLPTPTAITFDGTTHYLSRTGALSNTSSGSFSGYFKFTSPSAFGTQRFLLEIGSSGTNYLRFTVESGGNFKMELRDNNTLLVSKNSNSALTVSTAYEVWCSYNAATGVSQIWINTAANMSAFGSSNIGIHNLDSDFTNAGIGAAEDGAGKFSGSITRVALWGGVAADTSSSAVRDNMADPASSASVGGTALIDFFGPPATWNAGAGQVETWVANGTFT